VPGLADVLLGDTIHAELADPATWAPQQFEKNLTEAGMTVQEVVKP
jgi:hypothetical protein